MSKLNANSISRLKGVEPRFVAAFHKASESSPHNFQIPGDGGVRTVARQKELYAQGRTDLSKKKVTDADGVNKKSNHQVKADGYGHAIDIFILLPNGKASWDKKLLKETAEHIIKVCLEEGIIVRWGGDFNMDGDKTTKDAWDYPHFEIKSFVK